VAIRSSLAAWHRMSCPGVADDVAPRSWSPRDLLYGTALRPRHETFLRPVSAWR